MRKFLALVFVATISTVFATLPADAQRRPGRGVVTSVDYSGNTFICHWQSDDWTYRTTNATAYSLGESGRASFSDVQVGTTVEVEAHEDGGAKIADRVIIIEARR